MSDPNSLPDNGSRPQSAVWRIFERKQRWGLSWRGRLCVASVLLLLALVLAVGLQPFLAVNQPVDSKILVVEGWVAPFAIEGAAREFKTGNYDRIYTTGGPVSGGGGYINDFKTEANIGYGRLREAGIPGQLIQMVPSRVWNRNRTYNSALALRDWFQEHNLQVDRFNVLTEGAHARRTWLLFREAFGPGVKVGIISVPNPDYDPKYWWKYSDGVREVSSEALAYLYAKFLFWPGETKAEN